MLAEVTADKEQLAVLEEEEEEEEEDPWGKINAGVT